MKSMPGYAVKCSFYSESVEVHLSVTVKDMSIFNQLNEDELIMVSNYASSLIRNRGEHTDAYDWFQSARERILNKNPMSDEEITKEIYGAKS